MNTTTRTCTACGSLIKGRMDKKFCNDYCRNNHNNRLNGESVNYIRNVNNILRRNRRILEEFMQKRDSPLTTSRENLQKKGYNFNFYTSSYYNKGKEIIYYYCYEYGYAILDEERCLLVPNTYRPSLA
jgi:hypothetical protein